MPFFVRGARLRTYAATSRGTLCAPQVSHLPRCRTVCWRACGPTAAGCLGPGKEGAVWWFLRKFGSGPGNFRPEGAFVPICSWDRQLKPAVEWVEKMQGQIQCGWPCQKASLGAQKKSRRACTMCWWGWIDLPVTRWVVVGCFGAGGLMAHCGVCGTCGGSRHSPRPPPPRGSQKETRCQKQKAAGPPCC